MSDVCRCAGAVLDAVWAAPLTWRAPSQESQTFHLRPYLTCLSAATSLLRSGTNSDSNPPHTQPPRLTLVCARCSLSRTWRLQAKWSSCATRAPYARCCNALFALFLARTVSVVVCLCVSVASVGPIHVEGAIRTRGLCLPCSWVRVASVGSTHIKVRL